MSINPGLKQGDCEFSPRGLSFCRCLGDTVIVCKDRPICFLQRWNGTK